MSEEKIGATKNIRFLDFQDIQSIARQCLEALDFLHGSMRLTHTDLKLENVGGPKWVFPKNRGTPKWIVYNGKPD